MAELPPLLPEDVFAALPKKLRTELLEAFGKIVQNYSERRWEPAELSGGKLCEIVYSVVKGVVDEKYPPKATKPKNMVASCKDLENAGAFPRSVKIQIPRMIMALYEIRNNRNVGHVGGDVDPNHMDAVCVLQMSKWLMAELIRVLHERPLEEAAEIVDALVERETPLIWRVDDKIRVLDPGMSMKDKALLILHANAKPLRDTDLIDFIEHSNPSACKRDVLRPAHKRKLIEYDEGAGIVTISPAGIEHIEALITSLCST